MCPMEKKAPDRRQAISWTNDDTVHWRIYASPGINELGTSSSFIFLWRLTRQW